MEFDDLTLPPDICIDSELFDSFFFEKLKEENNPTVNLPVAVKAEEEDYSSALTTPQFVPPSPQSLTPLTPLTPLPTTPNSSTEEEVLRHKRPKQSNTVHAYHNTLFSSNTSTESMPSPAPTPPFSPVNPTPPSPQVQQPSQDPQQQQSNNQLSQLLDQLSHYKVQQQEDLDKIQLLQRQFFHQYSLVLSNPQADEQEKQQVTQLLQQVEKEHAQLEEKLNREQATLKEIHSKLFLGPPQLHKLTCLKREFFFQQNQITLYKAELVFLVNSRQNPIAPSLQQAPSCYGHLVIVQEPFPMVITKGKQLQEEQLIVKLILGSSVELKTFTTVRATMNMNEVHQPKNVQGQKMLDFDSVNMDPITKEAKFPLKFLAGTRKGFVTIKFSVQAQLLSRQTGQMISLNVESPPTKPFVVITNECQWEGSEGGLFKRDTFGDAVEVTWIHMCNALTGHFIKATRQHITNPVRTLSPLDFIFFNAKFFECKQLISQKDFEVFWTWYGKSLQTLRYSRHMASMYQAGYIYGFISREEVISNLVEQDPGTFLVRFSESHPGQIAIGYVATELTNRVKHYLVQQNDFSSKKPFPDFLIDCPQFIYILQAIVDQDGSGKIKVKKSLKTLALDHYVSKKEVLPHTGTGYDPLA